MDPNAIKAIKNIAKNRRMSIDRKAFAIKIAYDAWREEEHKRDGKGRFTSGGGSGESRNSKLLKENSPNGNIGTGNNISTKKFNRKPKKHKIYKSEKESVRHAINNNVSQERIKPGARLKFDHGSHSYFVKVIDYDDYEILEKIPIHKESAKYYDKEYKRIDEKTGKRKIPKNR